MAERESLLSRARRGSRPRTASSSLIPVDHSLQGSPPRGLPPQGMMRSMFHPGPGYAPAATEEADLADQHNPFADPMVESTAYDPGAMVRDDPDEIRRI